MFLANAGTPLMWAGCLWLLVGNWILGNVEARIVSWITKRPTITKKLITANYVSMAVGFGVIYLAGPVRSWVSLDPIRWGLIAFVGLMACAWFLTILVEWPFIASAVDLPRDRRTLGISAGVQTLTYLGMVLVTLWLGSISALTDLRPAQSIPTVGGWLYMVGVDGQTVYRVRVGGSRKKKVTTIKPGNWKRVIVEPIANEDRCRLILWGSGWRGEDKELIRNLGRASQAAPVQRDSKGQVNYGNGTFGYGRDGSTRSFVDQHQVFVGYWPVIGMSIDDRRYALETPVLAMSWQSPIVLPDGKVIAQLGLTILLVDPATGRAMKLANGSCGDVLLDLLAR